MAKQFQQTNLFCHFQIFFIPGFYTGEVLSFNMKFWRDALRDGYANDKIYDDCRAMLAIKQLLQQHINDTDGV